MGNYNPKRRWFDRLTAWLEIVVVGQEAVDRANNGPTEEERAIGRRDIESRKQTWTAVFSFIGSIVALMLIGKEVFSLLKYLRSFFP